MAKETTNTTKLGLFVTMTVLLFIIAVYSIGNTQNLFGSTIKIASFFQNVKGLQQGNNVRYAGINVGTVNQIVIVNDSTIRVDMVLGKQLKTFLKKDAIASIASDGLVGNMIVNINPGKGNARGVEIGDTLQSYSRVEAGDMMNTLGNITENIALLTMNLLEVAATINRGKGTAAMLINDSIMALDIQLAVRNLRQTTQQVNSLSSQFQQSMDDINQGQGLIGYLLKDSTFEHQVNHLTEGLDTLIRSRTIPIINKLETSSENIAHISASLDSLVSEIDLHEGLVGAVLKDSIAASDFKKIMHNLNKGTDRFNENMEALKHNFFFRKYFRKQEKRRKKELKKKVQFEG